MTNLLPGRTVKTFTTKKGKQAVIRYPKWEDEEYIDQVKMYLEL